MNIEIKNFKEMDGKVKGYFTVLIDGVIWLTGFKLIESQNGYFVAGPNRKKPDGEYQDYILMKKEVRESILEKVLEEAKIGDPKQIDDDDDLPF